MPSSQELRPAKAAGPRVNGCILLFTLLSLTRYPILAYDSGNVMLTLRGLASVLAGVAPDPSRSSRHRLNRQRRHHSLTHHHRHHLHRRRLHHLSQRLDSGRVHHTSEAFHSLTRRHRHRLKQSHTYSLWALIGATVTHKGQAGSSPTRAPTAIQPSGTTTSSSRPFSDKAIVDAA